MSEAATPDTRAFRPHLRRILDIAGKEDEAKGIGVAVEGALLGQKLRPGTAEDGSTASDRHF